MACFESRFGDTVLMSRAYTPVPVDFWFAPPQDIRKLMTSKIAAIRYADSVLSTLISYAKNIISKGASAFNYPQVQYLQDQKAHLQAIDSYMSSQYNTGILTELASKFNELIQLFEELQKLNPDVGQLSYIQSLLATRKAAGENVGPVQFIPQFSQDKTPILVTPQAGVPGSQYPEDAKKSSIGTILLVAVGAIVAFNAMKG